jgi:TonB family protein
MALGLTALQAAIIFSLSDRSPPEAFRHEPVPSVRVAAWDLTTLLSDPRFLALPTEQGFAGIGWRAAADPQYVSQDWTEPMPWLNQSETGLARALFTTPAVGIGRGVTADKPAPQFPVNHLPMLALAEKTVVRLEGAGAQWEWVEPLDAPSITHSNVLGQTIVRVTVDRSGQVFSPVVLRSSGLKAVDQLALDLSLSARFRITRSAAGPEEWAFARLIFEWRTEPPGAGGSGATAGEVPAPRS